MTLGDDGDRDGSGRSHDWPSEPMTGTISSRLQHGGHPGRVMLISNDVY